ncbi:MAG: ImmA/IrrE family metallo-endopeptidase, partial [Chloroflexi bacterium]|nr:ImmA/IrrE family metallo-endopeptidase [Chloroflexota bacterium]
MQLSTFNLFRTMSFIHPGREFVEKYGSVRGREDVLRYAAFLRAESGLGASSAADLTCIYARFHIPLPKRKPLPNQQGLLLMPSIGLMVINSEDPAARQRFTEAHELMELLFDTLPDDPLDRGKKGAFKHAAKERLCNEGAAELLMPGNMFAQRGQAEGVSFATARKLAGEFDVSPTAALVQLARVGEGRCAVALWRMKHKPS